MQDNNRTTIDGQPLPSSLKLAFTNAIRQQAVNNLFDPAIKTKIDPMGYVVKRDAALFDRHIRGGHGSLLVNDQGDVFSLTMAWHAVANDNTHRYTETGTTLTRLQGFHSGQVVAAALVLKEWWNTPPKKKIVSEILEENIPSRKVFENLFHWRRINRKTTAQDIDAHCNGNVVEDLNPGKKHFWYVCDDKSLPPMARSLLTLMDQGALIRKDGTQIKIDLSAMNEAGMSRARLEAIANGTVSRRALRKIAP